MEAIIDAIVIAGTQSGAGKTTLTLGLMAALRRRGRIVAPFKVGPDFIDPGHHARAAGRSSRNLDGWMLTEETNREIFARGLRGADIAVVEGVMGLYDGYDGATEAGSTAQMAKWLGIPVVLVVSARSMARSAAALVSGFERFDPDLRFAGVVFNHLGGPRHLDYLKQALAGRVTMPILGGIFRDDAIAIPERHLGLVTDEEFTLADGPLDRLADVVERSLDLDALLAGPARDAVIPANAADSPPPRISPPEAVTTAPGRRPRIGVARDEAFCFYYPDNLEYLEAAGAEVVAFSPLRDPVPPDVDGLYLGGGYPELHAAVLAGNGSLRTAIREASMAGMPMYAECGGFMYLCERLIDADGASHAMCGCFPFATRMFPRLRSLGYREVRLTGESILGPPDLVIRGHEFHYSDIHPPGEPGLGPLSGVDTVFSVSRRQDGHRTAEGFRVANTLGGYIHLHFGANPAAAGHFVASCRRWREGRTS